jgi:hypothetical protein
LDNPDINTSDELETRAKELNKLTDAELVKLAKKAKSKKDESEKGIEQEIKNKYYV